jgi:hypothetical protein
MNVYWYWILLFELFDDLANVEYLAALITKTPSDRVIVISNWTDRNPPVVLRVVSASQEWEFGVPAHGPSRARSHFGAGSSYIGISGVVNPQLYSSHRTIMTAWKSRTKCSHIMLRVCFGMDWQPSIGPSGSTTSSQRDYR